MKQTATAAKTKEAAPKDKLPKGQRSFAEIGRASCRERV